VQRSAIYMSLRQRAYRFADGASALAGLGGPVDHHGKVLRAAGPECGGPHVASPRSVAAGSPHRRCLPAATRHGDRLGRLSIRSNQDRRVVVQRSDNRAQSRRSV